MSTVEDGESAIQFFERRGLDRCVPVPHIILLDLKLPKVDGHQVLAYVKTNPALRRIPVLAPSGSRHERDIQYEIRANCYLTKPVDLDEYFGLAPKIDGYWLTDAGLC